MERLKKDSIERTSIKSIASIWKIILAVNELLNLDEECILFETLKWVRILKNVHGTRKSHVKIENLYLKSTQVFIGGRYRF